MSDLTNIQEAKVEYILSNARKGRQVAFDCQSFAACVDFFQQIEDMAEEILRIEAQKTPR